MFLRRIKLQNFKSFKLVDVPLKQRLVFITGINQDFNTTNYVGKSSLLDGIMYGLFGRSKVQPKYLVRLGTKQMSVELDLLVNNSEIHISRTRNQNSSNLEVTVDQKKLQGTVTEIQSQLENLLQSNYNLFTKYSVIDNVKFLDMEDLSTSELRDILTELTNLDKIKLAIQKIKQLKRDLQSQQTILRTRHYPSSQRLKVLKDSKDFILSNLQKSEQELEKAIQNRSTNQVKKVTLETRKQEYLTKVKTILNSSKCPICRTSLEGSTKTQVLNYYQTCIKDLESQIEKLLKQEPQTEITDLRNQHQLLLKKLNQITLRETQLHESMSTRETRSDIEKKLHLYSVSDQVLNQINISPLL